METDNSKQSNLTKIEIDSDKKSVTITTADGKEGVNVTNIQGGCMVVILGGMVSADEPQPEPQPEPEGPTPAKVINCFLKIKNTISKEVAIDDRIELVLANPDRNGFYYGDINGEPWTGCYNNIEINPYGTGDTESIIIPADGEVLLPVRYEEVVGSVYNSDLSLYGKDVVTGLGGRNPVSVLNLYTNGMEPVNVRLFFKGKTISTVLDPFAVFEEGKTYTITIR